MPTFAPQIAYHLERYRVGDADSAFHGLLELDHEVLPELAAEFRAATDTRLRVFLLGVIWQHRQQSVIPLLAEALLASEPQVWREALDGLVALASPASLEALRAARTRHFTEQHEAEQFRRWLEEAIEQAEMEAQRV
jgi:HEAT repeat protein